MILKATLLSLGLIFSASSFAKTLDVRAEFEVNSESTEIDKAQLKSEAWVLGTNQYGDDVYIFEASIDESELPISKSVGDASFSISKSGKIDLDMSVGDFDASASGSVQWPLDSSGNWIVFDAPLELSSSGGDHASGMWGYSAVISVKLRN